MRLRSQKSFIYGGSKAIFLEFSRLAMGEEKPTEAFPLDGCLPKRPRAAVAGLRAFFACFPLQKRSAEGRKQVRTEFGVERFRVWEK